MTELERNLREIIEQKKNVLLPENIKKDIEILGVVGSYEIENYNEMLKISRDILGLMFSEEDLEIFYDISSYSSGNQISDEMNQANATIYGTEGVDYQKSEKGIVLNGGYIKSGYIDKAYGTWEILCKVNSNFVPVSSSQWHACSCILGSEISDTQQDFGVILDRNGNYAIGWANSSITSSTVKANDGKYHHIVITYENGLFELYVDNILIATQSYTMKGTIPSAFGMFYNSTTPSTKVEGEILYCRYYSRVLSEEERNMNYDDAVCNYLGGI